MMKKRTLRITVILLILMVAVAAYIWFFVYNKPHRDYLSAPADFELTPQELYSSYITGYDEAVKTYNGKMIALTGTPDTIEETDGLYIAVFLLSDGDFGPQGVRCTFIEGMPENTVKPGESVTIKGFCSGFTGYPASGFYDGDVILEKCSVVKP